MVFKRALNHGVDRVLGQVKRKQFNHATGGLNQQLVVGFEPQLVVVMDLRTTPLNHGPSKRSVLGNPSEPGGNQAAFQQGRIEQLTNSPRFGG